MTTNLGLVCLTSKSAPKADRISYRTIKQGALNSLSPAQRITHLRSIYVDNANMLIKAIKYCHTNNFKMYRMSSGAFPFADMCDEYRALLPADTLRSAGVLASNLGVRLLSHPEQYCVLASDKPSVIKNSIAMLALEAHVFDLIGLPQNHWAPMNVHIGTKVPNAIATIKSVLADLPHNIKSRLSLENDERKQDAAATLEVCITSGVAFMYDYHHELISGKLDSYDHPAHLEFVKAGASTWGNSDWQTCHISNGRESFHDISHADFITVRPSDLSHTPWLEVEAKEKELALRNFPGLLDII